MKKDILLIKDDKYFKNNTIFIKKTYFKHKI